MTGKQNVGYIGYSKVVPASSSALTGKQKGGCVGYSKVVPASSSAVVVSSMKVVPASSSAVVVSSSGKRGRTHAYETQSTSKAVFKHSGGGCSAKFSNSEKAGTFVDKRSGNHGFKQEVKYKSSVKVHDKVQGCTTEYETQVKHKKVTTYNTPKKPAAAPKSSSVGKSIVYYHY